MMTGGSGGKSPPVLRPDTPHGDYMWEHYDPNKQNVGGKAEKKKRIWVSMHLAEVFGETAHVSDTHRYRAKCGRPTTIDDGSKQ